MQWEDFTSTAPYTSDRWATSDRGWLYLDGHEHPDAGSDLWSAYGFDGWNHGQAPLACGNYLRYSREVGGAHDDGREFHAVAYLLRVGLGGQRDQRIALPDPWYASAADAKAAIMGAVLEALRPAGMPAQLAL